MKIIVIIALVFFISGCSAEKTEKKRIEEPVIENTEENDTLQSSPPVLEIIDQTDEIYLKIKDIFSGSWMEDSDVVDGQREVSWGVVPFSNQSYFIIDFQNGKKVIIDGSSEGGGIGFDRFIAEVIKIELIEPDVYRFTYKNTISTRNSRKEYVITLKYTPDKDTLSILEYYGARIENPSEMIRVSEPISP